MSSWIDVTPGKWYFNDIEDLMDVKIDGIPLYAGISYNIFAEGKHAVDFEFVTTVDKLIEFRLDTVVYSTESNPLVVFVNGLVVACDEITPNNPAGKTYIKLRRSVRVGSSIRVFYAGEPKYVVVCSDLNGTPIRSTASVDGQVVSTLGYHETVNFVADVGSFYQVSSGYIQKDMRARYVPAGVGCNICGAVEYPSALLVIDSGYSYLYDPYEGYSSEVVRCMGKQLKRVDSTDKFITGDEYTVDSDRIIVPYRLNNEVLDVSILEINSEGLIKTNYKRLKPTSKSIIYNNRFFPDVLTTRAEFITIINRLRLAFTRQFTDSEPWRSSKSTSRFIDVQYMIDNGNPWWWENVRDIEELKLGDGSYVINERGDSSLGVEHNITRAEMVTILDKFREWFIESFK